MMRQQVKWPVVQYIFSFLRHSVTYQNCINILICLHKHIYTTLHKLLQLRQSHCNEEDQYGMCTVRLNTDIPRTSLDHRRGHAGQKYAWSAVQRSPQCGKIYVGEVGVLPQLPVCVVAHPGIILWLPVEAEEKRDCRENCEKNSLWHKLLLSQKLHII